MVCSAAQPKQCVGAIPPPRCLCDLGERARLPENDCRRTKEKHICNYPFLRLSRTHRHTMATFFATLAPACSAVFVDIANLALFSDGKLSPIPVYLCHACHSFRFFILYVVYFQQVPCNLLAISSNKFALAWFSFGLMNKGAVTIFKCFPQYQK
jgi:hypothetical protein